MGDFQPCETYGLSEAGIHKDNFEGNALIYDLLAISALDSVAQAVGSIDLEAARFIRLAQGVIRYRHNLLKEMVVFSPTNPNQKERFHVSGSHRIFERVRLATNRDTAEIKKAHYEGESGKLLDKIDCNIDGTLLYDIQAIMDIELFLKKNGFTKFYRATNHTEEQALLRLQHCCRASFFYLDTARMIIRNKITNLPHSYICTACGYSYPSAKKEPERAYTYPDPCVFCNSPTAWVSPFLHLFD